MVVKARSSCTVSPRFLVVYYMTYRMAPLSPLYIFIESGVWLKLSPVTSLVSEYMH